MVDAPRDRGLNTKFTNGSASAGENGVTELYVRAGARCASPSLISRRQSDDTLTRDAVFVLGDMATDFFNLFVHISSTDSVASEGPGSYLSGCNSGDFDGDASELGRSVRQ